MVRVYAPLGGMDASGTLANAYTFSKWKGRNYVRKRVVPSNPQSAAQVAMRSMLRFASQIWYGLTAGNKATWDDLAAAGSVSPFNAFVGTNQDRWNHFKGPTKETPAAEVGAGGDAPTTTVTAGVKELSLSIADGVTPPAWGWLIHRSTTTGFTPSRSTLIAAIERTATPTVYLDTPLDTGVPYYYRVGGFSDDGVKGTLEAEKTGTPT
jgi:hypothetical protein